MKKSNKINVTIRKRTNKIYVDYLKDGKRVQKSTNLEGTKDNYELVLNHARRAEKNNTDIKELLDIEVELQAFIAKSEAGVVVISSDIKDSLSDLLKVFIEEKENNGINTYRYQFVVNQFIDLIGDKMMNKVVDSEVKLYKTYLEKKELSYHTIQTYVKHLHIFFKWLVDNDHIAKNPITKLKEREKQHITIIPDEDMNNILDAVKDTPIYNFIRFIRYTAFRRSEAYNLKWSQIDFKLDIIRVITYKDSHREDTFPLNVSNGELREMLKDMYKNKTNDIVFNLNLHEHTILKTIRKKTKHLDIPNYTLHDMRRTTCTSSKPFGQKGPIFKRRFSSFFND